MFWLPHSLSLAPLQETIHLLLLHIRPIPGQRDEAIFEMPSKMLMRKKLTCIPIAFHTRQCIVTRISGPSQNRPHQKPKTTRYVEKRGLPSPSHQERLRPPSHKDFHLWQIASNEVSLVVVHTLRTHCHVKTVHLVGKT